MMSFSKSGCYLRGEYFSDMQRQNGDFGSRQLRFSDPILV
jgi:hypothetical protein